LRKKDYRIAGRLALAIFDTQSERLDR